MVEAGSEPENVRRASAKTSGDRSLRPYNCVMGVAAPSGTWLRSSGVDPLNGEAVRDFAALPGTWCRSYRRAPQSRRERSRASLRSWVLDDTQRHFVTCGRAPGEVAQVRQAAGFVRVRLVRHRGRRRRLTNGLPAPRRACGTALRPNRRYERTGGIVA